MTKLKKATGPDGISNEMLGHLGSVARSATAPAREQLVGAGSSPERVAHRNSGPDTHVRQGQEGGRQLQANRPDQSCGQTRRAPNPVPPHLPV